MHLAAERSAPLGGRSGRVFDTELALGALGAQRHAVADTLVVRPPVVGGVLVLARLPSALCTGQRMLVLGVGHAAETTRSVTNAGFIPPPVLGGRACSAQGSP
jgi:hypothetical protein